MRFGDFELSIIRECTFKLDGGAMFGVVPKVLWNKASPSDNENRIKLACNLLLIETNNGRVLVETGMGNRWSQRDKERYEVNSLVDHGHVLSQLGLSNTDVDAVVISHLHFDHIGGATRLVDGKLTPTFPKAKYFIQKGEWDFAHSANARAKGSYRPDDYEPLLENKVLQLIDGDFEVMPGVWVRVTGGHTKHHQVITFESQGNKGVYFADILPTKHHLQPPWVMAYDHYPLLSCDIKDEWLSKASQENWLVVFDHELDVPWGHVSVGGDKKYVFNALAESSLLYRTKA